MLLFLGAVTSTVVWTNSSGSTFQSLFFSIAATDDIPRLVVPNVHVGAPPELVSMLRDEAVPTPLQPQALLSSAGCPAALPVEPMS